MGDIAAFGVPYEETAALSAASVLGVIVVVLASAFWRPSARLLESPALQWLTLISFSLCLVHEPIIVAIRILTVDVSPWVGITISIPLAFMLAWFFARYVEKPSHRLAQLVGKSIEAMRRGKGCVD